MKVIDDIVDGVCEDLGRLPDDIVKRHALMEIRKEPLEGYGKHPRLPFPVPKSGVKHEKEGIVTFTETQFVVIYKERSGVVDLVMSLDPEQIKLACHFGMSWAVENLHPDVWKAYDTLKLMGHRTGSYSVQKLQDAIGQYGEDWLHELSPYLTENAFRQDMRPSDIFKLAEAVTEMGGRRVAEMHNQWSKMSLMTEKEPLLDFAGPRYIANLNINTLKKLHKENDARLWKVLEQSDDETLCKVNDMAAYLPIESAIKVAKSDSYHNILGFMEFESTCLNRNRSVHMRGLVEEAEIDELESVAGLSDDDWDSIGNVIYLAAPKMPAGSVETKQAFSMFYRGIIENKKQGTLDKWCEYIEGQIKSQTIGGGNYRLNELRGVYERKAA